MNINGLKKVGLGGLINSARIETDGSFRLVSEDGSVVVVGVPAGNALPKQFGIFDLSKFMNIANLVVDATAWNFDESTDSLIVKDAKRKFTYKVADASAIINAYDPIVGQNVADLVTVESAACVIAIPNDVRKDLVNAFRAFSGVSSFVIEDRDDGVYAVFGDSCSQEIVIKLSDSKMNRGAIVLPLKILSLICSVVDAEPMKIVVGTDDLPVMIADTYVKFYVNPIMM